MVIKIGLLRSFDDKHSEATVGIELEGLLLEINNLLARSRQNARYVLSRVIMQLKRAGELGNKELVKRSAEFR